MSLQPRLRPVQLAPADPLCAYLDHAWSSNSRTKIRSRFDDTGHRAGGRPRRHSRLRQQAGRDRQHRRHLRSRGGRGVLPWDGGRPVPDSVHAGDCRMTSRNTKPVGATEARRLLADGHVSACAVCRADSELGVID
ncbi:DUF6233 domain-containing protein [Streptomyces sp. NPDC101158]|uniref:DUF6233 domain-containing protein n=1 Tax=Streptomyces sp. NPDC101158 TaxID=3366117 RepID=UPI00382B99B2